MKISLLIPMGFTEPRRYDIFQWVLARWCIQFPDFQICMGTSDPENFNRSEARNAAFQQADGDILVITDADTATSKWNVLDAITIASRTQAWVIAHQTYWSLTREYTDLFLASHPSIELTPPFSCNWRMDARSEAGVLVMPREAYEAVEGYDERFNGWGFEDNAFATKLTQRWSQAQRTTGDVVHLWHERGLDFDQPHIKENETLYEEIRHGA